MESANRKRKTSVHFNLTNKVPKREGTIESEEKKITPVPFTALNVDRFAASRAIEIQGLTELVKNVGGNHQAFQKVPPHMRRRAMSHNIKRVPKRLHDLVKSELDKVKAPSRRPSRKYRRKPINLLSEYEQRRRRVCWLETHIWHAKRFKMTEAWGYKLPYHPSDKSIRSCYRAVHRHCLLQDVSYEHFIEVTGQREDITNGLCHITSEATGPTLAAKATSKGTRAGSLYLYNYDSYPLGVIGLVTYLWRPETKKDEHGNMISTLWISCHPSFEAEALRAIRNCFDNILKKSDKAHGEVAVSLDNNILAGSDSILDRKCNVSVTCLKSDIVKFRLYGPASNLVLKDALQLWDTNQLYGDDNNSECLKVSPVDIKDKDVKMNSEGEDMWWKTFYTDAKRRNEYEEQRKAWFAVIGCRSPAEAPPQLVMAVTVRDPRLMLPSKRIKTSVFDTETSDERLETNTFTTSVSTSPLWDESVRQNVKATKIAENTLNEMKSKQFVPGTKLELGEKESRIPVILIQRPGLTDVGNSFWSSQHQFGLASGWDLLIPSGWAMAFWVALVYRGARVGGQREAASIGLLTRQLVDVRDTPDSAAGNKELEKEAATLETQHSKRPPAKRPNFTKLGFDFPFAFPLHQLCTQWMKKLDKIKSLTQIDVTSQLESMYVLRQRRALKLLNSTLTTPQCFLQCQNSTRFSKSKFQKSSPMPKSSDLLDKFLSTDEGRKVVEIHGSAIVPVSVNVLQRGVPTSHAHICIPSKEDFKHLIKEKHYGGPEESLHPDEDAPRRKAERKERLVLRKKKKSGKKVGQCSQKTIIKHGEGKTESEENDQKVEVGIRRDDKVSSFDFINKTSRPIVGFVTKGDYNLNQGQGSALGFCSIAALLHLIEAQKTDGRHGGACLALIRNPTSLQYRFVSVSIII